MTTDAILAVTITLPGGDVLRRANRHYAHPSAPDFYEGRQMAGSSSRLRREIATDGLPFGAASADYGRLVFANADGADDALNAVPTYGSEVAIDLLSDADAPWDQRRPLWTGRGGAIAAGTTTEVRLLDDVALALDKPLVRRRLKGDNVAPAGFEGVPADTDTVLPALLGQALEFSPVLVNEPRRIFVLADRGPVTVDSAKDGGAAFTAGAVRVTTQAMQDTTPASGAFDLYPGDAATPAYLRLVTLPSAGLTVTARYGDARPAEIWRRALNERAGIAAGQISAADVTAFNAICPDACGTWTDGETKLRDALDLIVGGTGGVHFQDQTGLWRIRRFGLPQAADAVATLTPVSAETPAAFDEIALLDLQPLFTAAADGGRPFDQVKLRYGRYHRTIDRNSLLGTPTDEAKARWEKEWLEAIQPADAIDPDVIKDWKSGLIDRDPAAAEALRRWGIFQARPQRWKAVVSLADDPAGVLDLGRAVILRHPRWGFSLGKPMLITAMDIALPSLIAELTVWGAPWL